MIYELPSDLSVDSDVLEELQLDLEFINQLNQLEQEAADKVISSKLSGDCDRALIKLQAKVNQLQGKF